MSPPRGFAAAVGVLALLGAAALAEETPAPSESPPPPEAAPEADDEAAAPAALRSITVTSGRIPEDLVKVPRAVGVVDQTDVQLGRQQLGLDEALVKIPGLFLQNRYNLAQDIRISSRGFGARSSFGIRGLKVFVDGIPATLPDGQTGVDAIDIGSVGRIEVMRGPASSLYGAAAGGVIHVSSEVPPEQPFAEARLSLGEHGFEKYQLKTAGRAESLDYLVSVSHLELDGHREHGRTQTSLLNTRLRYRIDESSDFSVIFNAVDSPRADDPGGLTRAEAREDPTQAAARNVRFDVGEELDQQRLGLVYRKSFGEKHQLAARNYYVWRDFRNRLPRTERGSVDLERLFLGGGLAYTYADEVRARPNRLVVGFDVDAQRDGRKRFDNQDGVRGRLAFDQDEDVTAVGVYLQDRLELGRHVALTAGARYDRVEFRVDDDFRSDGDDSGRIDFDRVSPAVGLLWAPFPGCNLYGNVSTSFETPTTTELANPSGGGFNSELEPQTATNFEVGVKGLLAGRLRYDLALFRVEVEDELVPFELPEAPGSTFFRNAGSSTRSGVEFGLAAEPMGGLTASLAYTYSDFRYDEYETPEQSFDGNRLPGIPRHQLYGELAYRHASGFYAVLDGLYVGKLYVDDANRTSRAASFVSSLRIGHRIRRKGLEVAPFVGVHNLFDEEYDANVRINALGGRFFEPGPERYFYGGLSLRYDFGG